jgi:EF hand
MKATSALLFACAMSFAATGALAQDTTTQQQTTGAQSSTSTTTPSTGQSGSMGGMSSGMGGGMEMAHDYPRGGWGPQNGDWGWGYPGMGWRHYGWDDDDWGPRMRPWERHHMGGGWGYPGMMGGGDYGMMAHHGMMGPGGMHGLAMMIPMVMAMMDTNNDGALSLEEVQAVHARMFNFIDRNKDGKVTPDEVQMAFGGGSFGGPPAPMGGGATTGTGQGTTNQ